MDLLQSVTDPYWWHGFYWGLGWGVSGTVIVALVGFHFLAKFLGSCIGPLRW